MVLLGSGLVEFVSISFFHSSLFAVGLEVLLVFTLSLFFAQLYKKFLNVIILRSRKILGDIKL
jgi:hypothetical protein